MFRKQDTKIHFVGIGGMGMCGIAEVLANMGYRVSGSDMNDTEITRHLTGIGCTVKCFERHGHAASGNEPNAGFQEFSRDRLHAQVTGGYLFDLPPTPCHDVVLLVLPPNTRMSRLTTKTPIPTRSRMMPALWMLNPEVCAETANLMIAPTTTSTRPNAISHS